MGRRPGEFLHLLSLGFRIFVGDVWFHSSYLTKDYIVADDQIVGRDSGAALLFVEGDAQLRISWRMNSTNDISNKALSEEEKKLIKSESVNVDKAGSPPID